jgi:hypothetical protein
MQLASCVPFLFCRHSAKRQFLLNAESRYDGIWRSRRRSRISIRTRSRVLSFVNSRPMPSPGVTFLTMASTWTLPPGTSKLSRSWSRR